MAMKTSAFYGALLAAAKQAVPPTFFMQLASAVQGIIIDSPIDPTAGAPPMTVVPPLLAPTPVTGFGKLSPAKPAAIYGAAFALACGAPPTVSFYTDTCSLAIQVITDATVPSLGLVAPSGGGPITGLAKVFATKDALFYGESFAAQSKCPPTSSQAKQYVDIAQLVLDMLKDAESLGTGLAVVAGGGPVLGAGVLQ